MDGQGTPPVEHLLRRQDGAVVTLTLNRPGSLNALTHELLDDFFAVLLAAAHDPLVRCIVVTGAGERAFCAGADLKAGGDREPDEERTFQSTYAYFSKLFSLVRSIEKPIIAALNGVAAGAGQSLAQACDLRIAADTASFVGAFIRIGINQDTGGTMSLPALVGLGRAADIYWGGRRIYAAEALSLGMVHRVVAQTELVSAAHQWAQELATLPTTAIGLTKRAFNRALFPNMDAILELEARSVARAMQTHDAQEGVAALLERREARFTGQ